MAKLKDILVNAPEATGICCPYTGKPLAIYMRISTGVVTFSAPRALSLAVPWDDRDQLLKCASYRNGEPVEGASAVCAYTGAPLTLTETPDGKFYMAGAFNPRGAHLGLQRFIGLLSRREPPETPPRATLPVDIATAPDEGQVFELPQEAHERTERAAEEFVRNTGIDRTVRVSMAKKPKRSRRSR